MMADVWGFFVLTLMVMFAFSQTLIILTDKSTEFETFTSAFGTMFRLGVGSGSDFNLFDEEDTEQSIASEFYLQVYAVLLLLLLVLLEAMLTNAYMKVTRKAEKEYMFSRALTIRRYTKYSVLDNNVPPINLLVPFVPLLNVNARRRVNLSFLYVLFYLPGLLLTVVLFVGLVPFSRLGWLVNSVLQSRDAELEQEDRSKAWSILRATRFCNINWIRYQFGIAELVNNEPLVSRRQHLFRDKLRSIRMKMKIIDSEFIGSPRNDRQSAIDHAGQTHDLASAPKSPPVFIDRRKSIDKIVFAKEEGTANGVHKSSLKEAVDNATTTVLVGKEHAFWLVGVSKCHFC
jgi:hypothetical protein